ncbi:MAG: conserved membrane protein of unknown function [Promethearchaeota archaeon]|nr:MAG: conserved membrane protein of unknown function [Candidatus Lokiarchaeota archaeon]
MRQVQVTIPNEPKENIERVLAVLQGELQIKHMIMLKSEFNTLIIIRHRKTFVPEIIEALNKIGVGTKYGIVDILNLETTIPRLDMTESEKEKKKRRAQIAERVSVEEIEKDIIENSQPSFNYFLFILLSAIIAGVGLLTDSAIILIASMILSPLMGPILGLSFSVITKNKWVLKKSLISQSLGLLMAITAGLLLGLFGRFIVQLPNPTNEMRIRSFPNLFDIVISTCGGVAAGFTVTGRLRSSIVGIAIALSLMPPAANVGLALVYLDGALSLGSLILLISNILIINLCTLLIFKLKNIKVLPSVRPFWKGPEEEIVKEETQERRSLMKRVFSRKTK